MKSVVIAARSFVAYAENYTITLTHGFTMRPRSSPPQYVDMAGMQGKIVYSEGNVDREFEPCKEQWRSAKNCEFVLGRHKHLTPSGRALCLRNSHFSPPADPAGRKSDLLSLGVFLYASNVRLEPRFPLCNPFRTLVLFLFLFL